MSLLQQHTITVTIKRQVVTNTNAMGNSKTYTTAARGSLPTSATGRPMKAKAVERFAYGQQDQSTNTTLIFTTNPRVDNRDQFIIAATDEEEERTLNVLTSLKMPDPLFGSIWTVECHESSRQVK